ncbi:MAG: hypothetical protein IPJ06_04210 [Saprospiraceae bacterium]|nr:hypothetical protein [Saprospiraceae bacterium]
MQVNADYRLLYHFRYLVLTSQCQLSVLDNQGISVYIGILANGYLKYPIRQSRQINISRDNPCRKSDMSR